MTLYNMKTAAGKDAYTMVKFDDYLNVEKVYTLHFHSGKWHCNCEAYRRPSCRHRNMASIFIKARKVNSGQFYELEKEKWI